MVRLLSNEEIERHFSIEEYLPIAERMYRALGSGDASCTPIQTTLTQVSDPPKRATDPAFHGLRTMGGAVREFGVAATRLNSDVKHWPERHGTQVEQRLPNVDDRYNGLVFLFSIKTGAPLMIFPDGLIQPYHVAGGVATGAKHLARPDSTTLGMYGTGHQARTHLPALAETFDLDYVKVYSRTPENREEFADEMNNAVTATVEPVEEPRSVTEDVDIVNCATNSNSAVFDPDWIEPGTHVSSIRRSELPDGMFDPDTVDLVSVSTPSQTSLDVHGGSGYLTERDDAADYWHYLTMGDDPLIPKLRNRPRTARDEREVVRLPELLDDPSLGRATDDDVTLFRQIGHGVAFAAIGYALYQVAEREDLGGDLPDEKITQTHVP